MLEEGGEFFGRKGRRRCVQRGSLSRSRVFLGQLEDGMVNEIRASSFQPHELPLPGRCIFCSWQPQGEHEATKKTHRSNTAIGHWVGRVDSKCSPKLPVKLQIPLHPSINMSWCRKRRHVPYHRKTSQCLPPSFTYWHVRRQTTRYQCSCGRILRYRLFYTSQNPHFPSSVSKQVSDVVVSKDLSRLVRT